MADKIMATKTSIPTRSQKVKEEIGKKITAVKTKTPVDNVKSKEELVNRFLGNPMGQAEKDSDINPKEDPVDNIRHTSAARYTQESISKKLGGGMAVNIAAIAATNLLGVAHEARNFRNDKRSFLDKGRESAEDLYNNAVGSVIGALPINGNTKKSTIRKMSAGNLLADGYNATEQDIKDGLPKNMYNKDSKGNVNRGYKRNN